MSRSVREAEGNIQSRSPLLVLVVVQRCLVLWRLFRVSIDFEQSSQMFLPGEKVLSNTDFTSILEREVGAGA